MTLVWFTQISRSLPKPYIHEVSCFISIQTPIINQKPVFYSNISDIDLDLDLTDPKYTLTRGSHISLLHSKFDDKTLPLKILSRDHDPACRRPPTRTKILAILLLDFFEKLVNKLWVFNALFCG